MKYNLEAIAAVPLSTLKILALGGPVAVIMGSTGSILFGAVFLGRENEHTDVILALAITFIVLAFIEWTMARRFIKHEHVERADRLELGSSLMFQSKKNLEVALFQIEGVGALYETVNASLKELHAIMAERGPRLVAIEDTLKRLEAITKDLETWRARIGDRLGSLR
jgi:hypothetical protein